MNDPRLYQGQALQGQQPQGQPVQPQVQQFAAPQPVYAPPPTAAPGIGLHTLQGFGHLALAALHAFSGGSGDEDGEETKPSRPRPYGYKKSQRVGTGSCCRVKRPAK